MLTMNLIICCFCVWGIAKICNKFIRQSRINDYRFKFFELRDRLTLLVLRKQISSTDSNYITLLKLLNSSICVFDETYSFAGFFKYLSRIVSNRTLSRDIAAMIKQLKTHQNSELAAIACEYFELNYAVYTKYTHRTPLSLFVNLFSYSILSIKAASMIKERIELQKEINSSLENNLQQLRTTV